MLLFGLYNRRSYLNWHILYAHMFAVLSPETKQISFHDGNRNCHLKRPVDMLNITWYPTLRGSWWETLAAIHTGMLACCPRSPCHLVGNLAVPLHLRRISIPLTPNEGEQCARRSSESKKESKPMRIDRTASGPTSDKPGSLQVMRTLTFLIFFIVVLACVRFHPLTK